MALNTADTVNDFKTDLSIEPDLYSNSKNGTGVDFQDCAAEITVYAAFGMIGADSSLAIKLQESDDDSTYADIDGATMTTVSTASANNRSIEVKQFFNRSKRYVRAVGTMTGSSPDIDYSVILQSRKVSY